MVRNFKPKTNRKATTPRRIKAAIDLVKAGWSLRQAAKEKGVNRQTIFRVMKKSKAVEDINVLLTYKTRQIFSNEQEETISSYCIQMAQMGYGLSVRMCRELAFEVAEKNNVNMPPNWLKDKLAGIDWFHGFQKRHPEISIRTPEACSVARAMAFNKTNVKAYFEKYSEVRKRHPSFQDGSRVYNLDETNTSTVQNVRKILSPKGVKQIHQVKGAERGVSVTTCIIINPLGVLLPPVHIFPRQKFVIELMINCFPGALGLANKKGYMTKDAFFFVMKHFVKCTGSTIDNPSLLTLDNVETHFSTQTLDYAKEHGVTVFTFPPHCTHKLQPLDVGFFGPFKAYYDQAVNLFLLNNPATSPTIYHISGFVREALSKAATPLTIMKSFQEAGVVPFNPDIFTEADFIMASVTEKPAPVRDDEAPDEARLEVPPEILPEDEQSVNIETVDDTSETPSSSFVGPASIRGYPKAKETEKKRKRRKGKCMVATDTPERNEIKQREEEQEEKKKKAEERKKKAEERKKNIEEKKKKKAQEREEKAAAKIAEKNKKQSVNKTRKRVQRILSFESEESDGSEEVDDVSPLQSTPACLPPLSQPPTEGDYVIVAFTSVKGTPLSYFVGKILEEVDHENDLQISYLRKKVNSRDSSIFFTLPSVPDLNSVHLNDVKLILPKPTFDDGTRRQQSKIVFDFDFSNFKLG